MRRSGGCWGWGVRGRSAILRLQLAIGLVTAEVKLSTLVIELERRYRADQMRAPRGTRIGGQWIDERLHLAARKPKWTMVRCDGFSAGCQNGGTYNYSGMYNIDGRMLCPDCALRYLGIQDVPLAERQYLLNIFGRIKDE
jgi:hypothetical protein